MSKQINKQILKRFLKEGKRRKAIAKHYHVSVRTIARQINRFDLVGIAKKGRRPRPKKPEKIQIIKRGKTWIQIKDYIKRLNKKYQFVNIQYPPYSYINQKTAVCSNTQKNPTGKYTTAGIYFVVYISSVYFLYATSIRYTQKPVTFKEIFEWIDTQAESILEESYPHYYIVRIVAYTFSGNKRKPREIRYG